MAVTASIWDRAKRSWRRRSTATKILIILDVLAVFLIIGFFLAISALIGQQMRTNVDADLRHHIGTLRTILAWEGYYLRAEARTLAGLEGVDEALLTGDSKHLTRLATTVQNTHHLDAVYILSDESEVLLSSAPGGPAPATVKALDIVQQGFQGMNASQLLSGDEKVWLVSVAPHIREDGHVDAVFLVARELDHEYLSGVSKTLGTEVVLTDGQSLVSSFPPDKEAAFLETGLLSGKPTPATEWISPQDIRIGETPYRLLIAPLYPNNPSSLVVGLLQPTQLIEDVIRLTVWQVAVLGFLLISVPFVLFQFLIRRVFKPLHALMRAAETIAAGDLDQPVPIRGTVEVQILATSLDQMRIRLREYLEQQRRWNEELEAKVRERTQQIERLYHAREQLVAQLISAQRMLETERAFQQSIIDGVAEPIMVIDTNYQVRMMNRAAREFSPQSPETSPVLLCYQLSHQRDMPCKEMGEPCPLEQVRKLGHPITVVHEHLRADGERRLFEVIASPLWGEDGTFQGIIECMRDITERKRAEEKLKQYAKRLRALTAQLIEVAEAERQRVARELHDETSQALANLVVTLGMIARLSGNDEVTQRLEAAKQQAIETLEGVKRIILDLRPRLLDDYGLQSAIQWYAEERLGQAGVAARIKVHGSPVRLSPHTETGVFRVVQEAINNIVRHAHATEARIALNWKPNCLEVEVQDNGCGFDLQKVMDDMGQDRALGLLGMQERMMLVGGTLDIRSAPGTGTRIRIQVPLPEVEEGHVQDPSAAGG